MIEFDVKLAQGGYPPPLCHPCDACRGVCATSDHDRQLLAFCDDYDMALCTGRTLGDEDALPMWVSRPGSLSRVVFIFGQMWVINFSLRGIGYWYIRQQQGSLHGYDLIR